MISLWRRWVWRRRKLGAAGFLAVLLAAVVAVLAAPSLEEYWVGRVYAAAA